MEKNKKITLNQDKLVTNIQERVNFAMGPLGKLWSLMETEKAAMAGDENVDPNHMRNVEIMS